MYYQVLSWDKLDRVQSIFLKYYKMTGFGFNLRFKYRWSHDREKEIVNWMMFLLWLITCVVGRLNFSYWWVSLVFTNFLEFIKELLFRNSYQTPWKAWAVLDLQVCPYLWASHAINAHQCIALQSPIILDHMTLHKKSSLASNTYKPPL